MTGVGSSCGACKFLRRRCSSECIFAPYFSYEQAASHFAAVHKVFGASNVSKLLIRLPVQSRADAALTISYEAIARVHDPIYGCVAHIFALQQQVACLKEEIEMIGNQMSHIMIAVAGGHEITTVPHVVAQSDANSQQNLPFKQNSNITHGNEAFLDSIILESHHEDLN